LEEAGLSNLRRKEGKGREGKGREGKGREGKGREGRGGGREKRRGGGGGEEEGRGRGEKRREGGGGGVGEDDKERTQEQEENGPFAHDFWRTMGSGQSIHGVSPAFQNWFQVNFPRFRMVAYAVCR
jgi:hypothetical protein